MGSSLKILEQNSSEKQSHGTCKLLESIYIILT